MSPGIISSHPQPLHMPRLHRHHSPTLAYQPASFSSTSSTAVSSGQPSPVLQPADGKPPIPDIKVTTTTDHLHHHHRHPDHDTAAAAVPPAVSAEWMIKEAKEEVREARASSDNQSRRLDELAAKWDKIEAIMLSKDAPSTSTLKAPAFTRAYSESFIRPHTTKDGGDGDGGGGGGGRDNNSARNASQPPKKKNPRQATVEDCTDTEDDGSRVSAPAPARKNIATAATAPPSPTPMPPSIKEVRFSDERPTLLQRGSSSGYFSRRGGAPPPPPPPPPPYQQHREISPSPLDEKWGVLFRSGREPTRRLREVLRGLALHLIEIYKPSHSLVLTPGKLQKFYDRYALDHEIIDFHRIFTTSLRSLEDLYLDLQLEYHLVQEVGSNLKDRARVPALTPEGFVQWMIFLIRAFPDEEALRLSHVIADLPLEAVPDDPVREPWPRERLPRQISRHLFPSQPSEVMHQLMNQSFSRWRKKSSGASSSGADKLSVPSSSLLLSSSSSSLSPSRTVTGRGEARPGAQGPTPPPPLTPPLPLVHSDAKSREDHLVHARRERDADGFIEVIPAKRGSPPSSSLSSSSSRQQQQQQQLLDGVDERSVRHPKSYIRLKSPSRRSKRYERDARDLEKDRQHRIERRDCRWTVDGGEGGGRYRRRDGKRPRS